MSANLAATPYPGVGYGEQTGSAKREREPEIPNKINYVLNVTAELHNTISELEKRFSPVCALSAALTDASVADRRPAQTSHGAAIDEHTSALEQAIHRLRAIIRSCEL